MKRPDPDQMIAALSRNDGGKIPSAFSFWSERMTDNEFDQGLVGETERTKDGSRLCYKVAEGLSARAKEIRKERPDRASRLAHVAGKLMAKSRPTKKVLRDTAADVKIVRERMVDGVDEAVWD